MEKHLLAPLLIGKLGQEDGFRSFFSRLLKALAAVAAVIVWFAGREAQLLLQKTAVFFPFLKAGPATFTGGAALNVQGLLYGALALLLGYLLSELLQMLPSGASCEEGATGQPDSGAVASPDNIGLDNGRNALKSAG